MVTCRVQSFCVPAQCPRQLRIGVEKWLRNEEIYEEKREYVCLSRRDGNRFRHGETPRDKTQGTTKSTIKSFLQHVHAH